ncbi:hypothetical protein ZIOFF_067530 [Zingiber officinale]|uniref:Bifunctional inhibitor/plant lipid transfer protein/seed storage helical domain-containing protein n=1 Tax=Zingiber officinale TaxID=94328 RepID=A0A8J5EUQ0_ZINOF|nr:hypothetical protein ZIOFF_067530 [Zingiber officinale]
MATPLVLAAFLFAIFPSAAAVDHSPSASPDIATGLIDCLAFVLDGSPVPWPTAACCVNVCSRPELVCQAVEEASCLGFAVSIKRTLGLPAACSIDAPQIHCHRNSTAGDSFGGSTFFISRALLGSTQIFSRLLSVSVSTVWPKVVGKSTTFAAAVTIVSSSDGVTFIYADSIDSVLVSISIDTGKVSSRAAVTFIYAGSINVAVVTPISIATNKVNTVTSDSVLIPGSATNSGAIPTFTGNKSRSFSDNASAVTFFPGAVGLRKRTG